MTRIGIRISTDFVLSRRSTHGFGALVHWGRASLEIFTAMNIHVMVFWVATQRSDVIGYQRFGGPWRWTQLGPPKRWYPTSPRGVTLWIWRQKGPVKRWYPTISLHGITSWRWRQRGPPKRWYHTATLFDVTTWRWGPRSPPKRWYPTI